MSVEETCFDVVGDWSLWLVKLEQCHRAEKNCRVGEDSLWGCHYKWHLSFVVSVPSETVEQLANVQLFMAHCISRLQNIVSIY